MESSNAQELFLLEFLIDCVNIPSVQAMHEDLLNVKTCIEFKILNLPPIYICQDTPNGNCTCLGEDPQVFRKGKSCLFALPKKLLKKPICSFPITMSVYKKLPPTVLPDVMTIGSCQIETKDMINSLLDDCSEQPCKTLKSNFKICTATGQCVGEVGVFVRFSRLGKKVVTQFQTPHNKRPFLFKGIDNSPIFQCKRITSQPSSDDPFHNCVCEKDKKLDCKSEERPQKSCCKSARSPRTPKKRSRGQARPCCTAPNQSRSHGACDLPRDTFTKETRQCGCEVKEDKSYSCKN